MQNHISDDVGGMKRQSIERTVVIIPPRKSGRKPIPSRKRHSMEARQRVESPAVAKGKSATVAKGKSAAVEKGKSAAVEKLSAKQVARRNNRLLLEIDPASKVWCYVGVLFVSLSK